MLNLPKIAWKHAVLNNTSDDARVQISDMLAEWRHPLDTRRKDDNRVRAQKWFSGEKWASFCADEAGSPGGPPAIAALMLIVAEDMQLNGDQVAKDAPSEKAKPAARGGRGDRGGRGANRGGRGRGGRGGRNRAAFAMRQTAAAAETAIADDAAAGDGEGEADEAAPQAPAATEHKPSASELAADPQCVEMIRVLFGSRAQTIINALLAFDAYFKWYYSYKRSVPFFCSHEQRLERAFENSCMAIDMHEIYERIAIRNHKSFLLHGCIYKVSRDILQVGCVWAVNVSPLELQNAETKRVAESGGSRRLTLLTEGIMRQPMRGVHEGPAARLVKTKGYNTTMAISTLNNMLVGQLLRRGDGVISLPASRRHNRLFAAGGAGRTKVMSSGVKIEKLDASYDPLDDTCIKAFVRLLAARAHSEAGNPTA